MRIGFFVLLLAAAFFLFVLPSPFHFSITMDNQALFLIGDLPGYAPQIARLVSMLNYVRHTTLSAVKDLTIEELDHVQSDTSNSIGALLLHIAAAEAGYQAATFESRQLTTEERQKWGAALTLGPAARSEIRRQELSHYTTILEAVRSRTLAELAKREDAWLEEQSSFGDKSVNNYFKWFHVLTHEVNHRGQILLLRKQIKATVSNG